MLHQDSAPWIDVRANVGRPALNEISVLAYQSRAASRPTRADLNRLLVDSQRRNRAEGLTGLLVYDRGRFFQWLEGPSPALHRVWNSILGDPRHGDIQVLREDNLPRRFFESWDMRLGRCKSGGVGQLNVEVDAPQQLLKQLFGRPAVLADDSWNELFGDMVIPQLKALHPTLGGLLPAGDASVVQRGVIIAPAIWHAPEGTGTQMARILISAHSDHIARHLDSFLAQGASIDCLYGEVFEPAQRALGELWNADLCNDFDLTLALAKLQIEVHRLGSESAPDASRFPGVRSVLMSPQPGEPHGVGIAMSSELFFRDGWDVTCEFPTSDQGVCDLVQARWFDVLELSLSGALRRDHQLPGMRKTILAAHAASLNPALTVIVDGRTFFERPRAYLDIAADAGCSTALDGVRAAHLLVDALSSSVNSRVPRLRQAGGR